MRNINNKKCIPWFAIPCFIIASVSIAVYFIGAENMQFAEWVSVNLGYPMRLALAKITGSVGFSIAEILIALSPIFLLLIIFFASKKNGVREKIRYFVSLIAIISIFLSAYVYVLGIGYYRAPSYEKIGIEAKNPEKEDLYKTLVLLKNECEALVDEIDFSQSGSSVSPISFDEICEQICLGYERLAAEYPTLELELFDSKAKPVKFSNIMTYLDILGIYTFFTGESNVNVHYPDYTTPFTIAHEFAHQRGIARENEANFIAFLVCIRADNPYVRYSGYMNMFEYTASALAKTDREMLISVYREMDQRLYGEMVAYSDFYNANKSEILGNISEFFNDNYLKLQGNEGTVSYSMVVKLCVDYYCND